MRYPRTSLGRDLMPTYDYKCKNCDKILTLTIPLDGNHAQQCPTCGKEMIKKFGAVPSSFKGEGFYTNDKFTDR